LVLELNAVVGQGEKLKQAFTSLLQQPTFDATKEEIQIQTTLNGDSLFVSIKGTPEYESSYIEPFNMFFSQGVESLVDEQDNTIVGSLRS